MKIKVILVSRDTDYTERLSDYLDIRHGDRLELSVFNDETTLAEYLLQNKADMVLKDPDISVETDAVQICLQDEPLAGDEYSEIFKYQKGELIYKALLSIYASDANRRLYGNDDEKEDMKIHLFLPLNGGAGASTVAKAYAEKLVGHKKTLYLNLEMFGDCGRTLKGEGSFSFDDILYTLKSRRGSLSLKLEGALKESREGVAFYTPAANPMSMLELTEEEFLVLIKEWKKSGLVDEIVLDTDIFPSEWMVGSMKAATDIWLVADGTDRSSEKYGRFMEFIEAWEEKNQVKLQPKMKIFYNKCSRRGSDGIESCSLKAAGISPRYENTDEKTLMHLIAESDAFDRIK